MILKVVMRKFVLSECRLDALANRVIEGCAFYSWMGLEISVRQSDIAVVASLSDSRS